MIYPLTYQYYSAQVTLKNYLTLVTQVSKMVQIISNEVENGLTETALSIREHAWDGTRPCTYM